MEHKDTFDSTKGTLQDLLRDVRAGIIQLPEFQRDWVWDDNRVQSLLASVSLSYPIGAVMLLETGNEDVRFKPRLVEGVILENPPSPKYFILDGQQRLTALFQSLLSDHPVATKDTLNRRIFRWYYIRIDKALNSNGDRDEAIIALPPDRLVRNFRGEVIGDYSTIELECKAQLMPLSLVFNTTNQNKWMMRYLQMEPNHTSERLDRWGKVLDLVIQPFQHYQVPIIALHKETRKGAVCQVFEKVNTGGVTLNVFELLTATFAADNFNLRGNALGT
jgi:hypothetical protein